MRRLALDFQRRRAPSGRAGWLLLAIATLFAADVARSYIEAREETAQVQARLESRTPRSGDPSMLRVSSRPVDPQELEAARRTVHRLATPWERLFSSLEFAQSERVALLAVEPDAESGLVTLTGEARDYLSVLSYVETLSGAKGLSRVHLVRHEPKAGDPRRVVSFTASAHWKEAR